jgi:hypothetical protein
MTQPVDKHERKIIARARRMWREDGSHHGRMPEFIERARELQAIEDHPQFGLLPNPMSLHHGELEPVEPIEEAELMENLGEFPGRMTDQGDRSPVPMTRKKVRGTQT